jgi:hypothetical protein
MGCTLDMSGESEISTSSSRWTGSEVQAEDAPCKSCKGVYYHAFSCEDDPGKTASYSKWTRPANTCSTCFATDGHRATCPYRAVSTCKKCGMNDHGHNERMCLIKQATIRMRAKKAEVGKPEVLEPCPQCAGVLSHFYPCTNIININKSDMKVL